ncbi:tautomerase family protein [Paraburkholderia tropica]|uniref:Phenylpyruvate tautomerase PptA (4-oxalocrotonate tautomerase family) n=1 Tax=Paraburkholderia tropica TaxID=92647 RepID=A0ABX5MD89_9BURK|nr:tautomerase family protein [Paraburkholderia tropica]MBB3004693.1 phenylpyruvate tautomerase PptA (4-oxalocrotonate tautomerase family) [Paraburkholderia tropica]MBB6323491.1 phenylpyruvate tautomerase PptA (4-oxalocrotonate tautomerase family) [Paraburkholderia tropica]PXX05257.1 phenylpyruvate tautomerase PptA (4-oxalocrotonate tautomerase family) [Paraburkholderia tropica]PZW70576.1 phenylpyruvate tautomerase PptA (4-oxalocrotonate tautomerase family) [Paraburkholderia tropica]QNB17392.1
MPLVKINLRKGREAEVKVAIADAVQAALVNVLGIPDADRYAVINELDGEHFIHTPAYLDLKYSEDLLMIEITFIEGRPDETKKELLKDLNRRLTATGHVREDDVFVMIYEVGKANVSFGKGLAQRAL